MHQQHLLSPWTLPRAALTTWLCWFSAGKDCSWATHACPALGLCSETVFLGVCRDPTLLSDLAYCFLPQCLHVCPRRVCSGSRLLGEQKYKTLFHPRDDKPMPAGWIRRGKGAYCKQGYSLWGDWLCSVCWESLQAGQKDAVSGSAFMTPSYPNCSCSQCWRRPQAVYPGECMSVPGGHSSWRKVHPPEDVHSISCI